MRRRAKPAMHMALRYLRQYLEQCPAASRLPGLAALAAAAGVCHVTMLRAVHVLRDEGLCTVVAGQGVTAGRAEPVAHAVNTGHAPKWRGLQREIERDILHGRFTSGTTLPPLKELEARYGVAYSTLKRGLQSLVQDGILSAYGATYRLPHLCAAYQPLRTGDKAPGASSHRASLALIVGASRPEVSAVDDPRFSDFLYWLERESFTASFRLLLMTYDDSGADAVFHTPEGPLRRLADRQWILGYLVFYSGIGNIERLIAHLAVSEKPVALLTTGGQLPQNLRIKRLRVFHAGYTETPGRDVGTYLLSRGHRHVAYLSPYHRSPWSVNRLTGLRRAFESCGSAGSVTAFVHDEYAHNDDYLQQATTKRTMQHGYRFPSLKKSMNRLLHTHIDELRRAQMELYRDQEILQYCIPLFHRALQNRQVSAWVCCIDYIALFALSFLRQENISVPRDLSLIGFDDLPAARDRALSTYRFDMPTLVHAMVAHVLNPWYGPLCRAGNSLETGGMVVERASSGPAGPRHR